LAFRLVHLLVLSRSFFQKSNRIAIVDSYEQVRERPGDNDEQEKYYSGKESAHTFKSQIII
jgi:hypothetical protein